MGVPKWHYRQSVHVLITKICDVQDDTWWNQKCAIKTTAEEVVKYKSRHNGNGWSERHQSKTTPLIAKNYLTLLNHLNLKQLYMVAIHSSVRYNASITPTCHRPWFAVCTSTPSKASWNACTPFPLFCAKCTWGDTLAGHPGRMGSTAWRSQQYNCPLSHFQPIIRNFITSHRPRVAGLCAEQFPRLK